MAHKLDQQRALFRPTKSTAFFDDDDDDFSDYLTTDDTSSMARSLASSIEANSMRSDTLALAEFLTSTSPEEFAKPSLRKQHQRRASRILTRLRKRPTRGSIQTDNSSVTSKGSNSNQYQAKHIPLPSYQPPSLRDSGVYSEISDKDVQHYLPPPPVPPVPQTQQQPMQNDLQMFPMPPPTVPIKSSARPQRPAPLPEDVTSAAIAAASQQYQHHDLRSVPPAALKRRSIVRNRHVQVQATKDASDETIALPSTHNTPNACPHCRQHIGSADKKQDEIVSSDGTKTRRHRRLSSPPAMASGVLQQKHSTTTPDHNTLRQMIERLEAQLAEERQSRQKLEQVMLRNNHQATRKMEQVAEERSRWEDDCQWMQSRIASMSQ